MRLVCMDTSAWVALVFPHDSNHAVATALYRRLLEEGVTLVTTDYVLNETLTLLRRRGFMGRRMTIFREGIETARKRGSLRLVIMDEAAFSRAWDTFLMYEPQGFSFTDCHLAMVTRRVEADGVFSFDDRFKAFGLTLLPGS